MQIVVVDVCIDLLAVSPLSSIPSFISFLSWRYHPPSNSYQFKSPCSPFPTSSHFSATSPQSYSPVKMINWAECSVFVGAILYLHKQRRLSGRWSAVSQYYRLLLGDREMTNSASEWVCVCFNAFLCLYRHARFSSYGVSLFESLSSVSVFLWGQFAVWGPPQ